MTKKRKVHAVNTESNQVPTCGTMVHPILTTVDEDKVTCNRCRRLLGLSPYQPQLPHGYRVLKGQKISAKALDSLLKRAFKDSDVRLGELCEKARQALADWERMKATRTPDPVPENMADLLRGFISALGRAD